MVHSSVLTGQLSAIKLMAAHMHVRSRFKVGVHAVMAILVTQAQLHAIGMSQSCYNSSIHLIGPYAI